MLSRDQIELIHRDIDGATTPDERATVQSLIAREAEARALAEELRRVAAIFDQAGIVEPSPHLRQAILDALPRQVPAPSGWGAIAAAWQAMVDGFRKRPRFAVVSALCVGLVAGFGAYAALAGTAGIDRADTRGLAGAFFAPGADAPAVTHDVPIDLAGGSGRVRVTAGPSVVLVELASDVARTWEVRLTFPADAYGVQGLSQLRSEPASSFSAGPGRIRVTTSGENTHTFVLSHAGPVPPLALSLFEGGEEVFATTLRTREPDPGG